MKITKGVEHKKIIMSSEIIDVISMLDGSIFKINFPFNFSQI